MERYRLYHGKEIKKKGGEIMKRYGLFIIVLSLILISGLIQGCSDKTSPTEPTEFKGEITTSETAPSAELSHGEIYRARPVPDINVSPTFLDFGDVPVATDCRGDKLMYLKVKNTGTADLIFSRDDVHISGSRIFHLHPCMNGGACLNLWDGGSSRDHTVTLRPGEECTIAVAFLPQNAGTYCSIRDYIAITSNDPDERIVRVGLCGRGYKLRVEDIPRFEIDPHIPTHR